MYMLYLLCYIYYFVLSNPLHAPLRISSQFRQSATLERKSGSVPPQFR